MKPINVQYTVLSHQPANMASCSANIHHGIMSYQSQRQWADIKATWAQHVAFAACTLNHQHFKQPNLYH